MDPLLGSLLLQGGKGMLEGFLGNRAAKKQQRQQARADAFSNIQQALGNKGATSQQVQGSMGPMGAAAMGMMNNQGVQDRLLEFLTGGAGQAAGPSQDVLGRLGQAVGGAMGGGMGGGMSDAARDAMRQSYEMANRARQRPLGQLGGMR
tara:strand:+ start:410 stop:856 length:447 start_codon:yes stop_codon:yes gene_type:complete